MNAINMKIIKRVEINPFKEKTSDKVIEHNGKRMFHGIVFKRT